MDVVGQPVEKCAGQSLRAEHRCPFLEWKVRCDDGRAPFVTLAEHLEQKFCAGRRERHIAKFVDDQQLDRCEVALELQQPPLIAGLHKLMHQTGRRREWSGQAAYRGIVPWRTIGLTAKDAEDGYGGRYITYGVADVATSHSCPGNLPGTVAS